MPQSFSRWLPKTLRNLPLPALRVIVLLVFVNLIVWAVVGIVLATTHKTELAGTAVLSYTLGLRHALDADHISAIDLVTRRLLSLPKEEKQRSLPVTVGTYFSLGHSTIVIITCIVVAATSGALESRFSSFQQVGGVIGTSVSAGVILLLGVANAWILWGLWKRMDVLLRERYGHGLDEGGNRGRTREERPVGFVGNWEGNGGERDVEGRGERGRQEQEYDTFKIEGGGPLVKVFGGLFRAIDRPWKMYPVGVCFGLGFDTSSEVALLGIASIQAATGTSIWLILLYPLLFTAGMCLIDTTDGALMFVLYTSSSASRDTITILYYSILLTAITVVVAIVIGTIQVLSLVQNVTGYEDGFWKGVGVVGDHFEVLGGAICACFVVVGLGGWWAQPRWRAWVVGRCERKAKNERSQGHGFGFWRGGCGK